ncbi:MAG: helix-turn-helix domain-containing protein [Dorea sp.]|nr:helix-turn-helix domain-containing protein [Dorea sp.]
MSIQELAEQAEIDAAALREMEKNFHTINMADAATVYRLSKILGCRMEDLMEI